MTKQRPGDYLANRYRIEQRLGTGSSAIIFEATDTTNGQRVAVKVIHQRFRNDRTMHRRFLREARAVQALNNPHVVKVLEVGQLSRGIPFLVMELLEGSTLDQIIQRHESLPIERAMWVADQIASALQDAHDVGIIHRDLKPENVIVSGYEHTPFVKVVDFGISKLVGTHETTQLTGTSELVGTPTYMAPEQIDGCRDIDGRADVYSLGVVMYEMLTGVSPFASAQDFPGLLSLLLESPKSVREIRPEVPEGLAQLIAGAMAPERSQRIASMQSLRQSIAPYWRARKADSLPEQATESNDGPMPAQVSLFEDDSSSMTEQKTEVYPGTNRCSWEDKTQFDASIEPSFHPLSSLFEEDWEQATRREPTPFIEPWPSTESDSPPVDHHPFSRSMPLPISAHSKDKRVAPPPPPPSRPKLSSASPARQPPSQHPPPPPPHRSSSSMAPLAFHGPAPRPSRPVPSVVPPPPPLSAPQAARPNQPVLHEEESGLPRPCPQEPDPTNP